MAGEAAGPAPSWLWGQEVLTLSLQSDPALAGGRRMPRCSPESLPAAPWLGWQKGLLFNGLVFGDEAQGIPIPLALKWLRGAGRALRSLLAKAAGAEGKGVSGKGGVRKPPKRVTKCRLQAWRSCSASFSAELGRFAHIPALGCQAWPDTIGVA